MLRVVEGFLGGRREEITVWGRGQKFIWYMKKVHLYYSTSSTEAMPAAMTWSGAGD